MLRLLLLQHRHRGRPLGAVAQVLLRWHGTDIAPEVAIPSDLQLRHAGTGVVIHGRTTIGRNVRIFQGVSIARGRIWEPISADFGGFVVEDDAVLGAGCVVLNDGPEPLVVARGSVVGAGAVLTRSTGAWEVWAGNPARCISTRTADREHNFT